MATPLQLFNIDLDMNRIERLEEGCYHIVPKCIDCDDGIDRMEHNATQAAVCAQCCTFWAW